MTRRLFCAAAFLVAALLFLPAAGMAAEPLTLKDQILREDATWSGDILIEGLVVVGRRATLTIAPGTTIRFKKIDRNRDGIGDGELRVLGRLDAQGEAGRPIRFESAEASPEPRDWSYVLLFTAAGKNVVRHCEFRHGFSGLQVHFSTAEVTNCLFTKNNEGLRFGRAKLAARGNEFTANDIGIRFTRMEGPASLTNNRITGNRIGIFLVPSGQNIMDFFEPDRSGRPWNTGHLSITGNDIHDNLWYNVNLGEKQIWDLDITGNWWGSTDEERIRATIYAKNRDATLGRALFKPFLEAPATAGKDETRPETTQ